MKKAKQIIRHSNELITNFQIERLNPSQKKQELIIQPQFVLFWDLFQTPNTPIIVAPNIITIFFMNSFQINVLKIAIKTLFWLESAQNDVHTIIYTYVCTFYHQFQMSSLFFASFHSINNMSKLSLRKPLIATNHQIRYGCVFCWPTLSEREYGRK